MYILDVDVRVDTFKLDKVLFCRKSFHSRDRKRRDYIVSNIKFFHTERI